MDKERRTRRQQGPAESLHEQKSRWSSSSTFNRILGNLERSIFRQIPASNGNISSVSSISGGSNSEKRRNQMTKQTSAKWNPSNSNTAPSSSQPIISVDEQQSQAQHTGAARIAVAKAALKLAADGKLDSEKLGKLTLTKCQQPAREQQQKYPLSSMDSNQHLASNKSLIPPPHASDEARSINRSILMGGGLALDIQPKSFETSSANSSALSAATLRRGGKFLFERQQADTQHANRQNSSPASSARSLPMVGPKPGSQIAKRNNHLESNKDDEESGFSTYQSRRSFLLNHHLQQQQQQQDSQEGPSNKDEKMFLNHFNNHAMQTQAFTSRLYQPYINGNVHPSQEQSFNNIQHQFPMQRQHQQQQAFNQQVQLTHDRSQTQPSLGHRFATNGYSHTDTSAMNNLIANQPTFQQPRIAVSFNDSDQSLFQAQWLQERQSNVDNSQQIYANAPPKPRRHQYYDTSTVQNSANQAHVQLHMPTTYQRQMTSMHNHSSSGSSMNPAAMSGFYSTRDELLRLNPRQNTSAFNNTHRPQPPYPPYPSVDFASQPHGQHLMKSKSSLGVDDLMRHRQSRISNNETSPQQNSQQPIYGYHGGTLTRSGLTPRQRPSVLGYPLQQATGNLQRSKSVTHLLPEFDSQNLDLMHQDHTQQTGHGLSTVSSASTNQLNFLEQSLTRPKLTSNQHVTPNQHDHTLMNQFGPTSSNLSERPIPVPNNWIAQQDQRVVQGVNFQLLNKAKSMAALNLQQNISNRMIRQLAGNNFLPQQDASDGSTKPSLDDQIRHLLIGRSDNDPHRGEAINAVGLNRNNNATYNQNSGGNNVGESVPSSSSNATISAQAALPSWASGCGGYDQSARLDNVHLPPRRPQAVNQQAHQQHQPASSASGLSIDNEHINGYPIPPTNVSTSNQSQALSHNINNPTTVGHPLAQGTIDLNEMGNHQQRQYKVQQAVGVTDIGAQQQQQRQADANSQLIVDLTTPRVLARTQTTLVSQDSQQPGASQNSWSINQVGLPQFSPVSSQTVAPTCTSHSKQGNQANESSITTSKREPLAAAPVAENKSVVIERTAPYYYSDLKSEEQQRALMEIVQQKSLSPPPQLLSRSTDHSSTRLAPKSATLHSSHARTLSENLAQRQRQRILGEAFGIKSDGSCSSWATKNQSAIKESSSASNIAKNIDKLFERPLLDQQSKFASGNVANAAQSMLILNNCEKPGEDGLVHICLDQSARQVTNAGSTSSGYSSGEQRSKTLSKSRSLENISQKPSVDGTPPSPSKNLINPVYENIHRSDKLLMAINKAATFSPGAGAKSLSTIKSNSDESMDSILGSSLDASESDSDIIDDIKISSTDNHLNDITNLIEQLKINHSKLTEEYKSTLVRISRTINSRTVQGANSDKLARRLHLLELRSKKCESRSKNQLALIQMMEKVLRQSKLRALGNVGTGASSNGVNAAVVSANRLSESDLQTSPLLKDTTTGQSTFINGDDSAVDLGRKHSAQAPETDKPAAGDGNQHGNLQKSPDSINDASLNSKATASSLEDDLSKVSPERMPVQKELAQEIIRAIVTEKEVGSSGDFRRSKALMDEACSKRQSGQQSANDRQVINGFKSEQGIGKKNNAVTKRILDIEKRQNGCVLRQKSSDEQRSKNPFYSSSSASTSSASGESTDNSITLVSGGETEGAPKSMAPSLADKTTSHQNSSRVSDSFMRDDEDFIEFLCDDIAGRRSQFEASQFSASDFNTSTSNSESSTSTSSAASDSMNSILPNADHVRRSATTKASPRRTHMESCEPVMRGSGSEQQKLTAGIIKKATRRSSHDNNNTCTSPPLTRTGKHGAEGNRSADSAAKGNSEKFKNVLGNVIDVDVYHTVNNLSQCSPVNNPA